MSRKEVPRAGLVKAALEGKITNAEGAHALRLSVRHFKRLKARLKAEGAGGLLHRSRGRPSARRLAPAVAEQIAALMTTLYAGFNDVHLTEKLQEHHALPVSRATVRRVRLALGQPAHRRRRAPKHRRRRPRVPAIGQLVQLDASPFDWFEARGPRATLHGAIDDASSRPVALYFQPHETLHGYVTVLEQTCRHFGLPVTLYGDRLNVFVRNDRHWSLAEQLAGERAPTHFGRILADLGIGFIAAQSPQAKGRIERLWGTLQDRLVSELRLRGIRTLETANAVLPDFLADFGRRFTQPPASPTPAWRPAPRDLDRVLSCRYTRLVARDNTVRVAGRWAQIPPGPGGRSYAGCRVEVRELLDGRLLVFYQGARLVTQPAPPGPFVLAPRDAPSGERRPAPRAPHRPPAPAPDAIVPEVATTSTAPLTTAPRHRATPAPTHPWRTAFSRRRRQQQRQG